MKKTFSSSLLLLLSFTAPIFGMDVSDQNAIHQIIEHSATAWNDHQNHGFADHYTQDADFVNIFGMAFTGKEEIETRHIKILETFLKGSTLEVLDVKLREATPEVVIAQVSWKVQKPGNDLMKGIFTHVFVKNNDTWEITASQNTLIKGVF